MTTGRLLVCVAVLLGVTGAPMAGGIIGNWSGSSRSWNHPSFATIRSLMISQGHTVLPDSAISSGNLAGVSLFVIGEPTTTPGSAELSALQSWVQAGGVLLLLSDAPGFDSVAVRLNAISTGLGASLVWSGNASNNTPLAGGVFATTGPPYNVVGQTLQVSPATAVSGGTALAGDYLGYQQIGLGYIFGFGDRSDNNFFNPSTSNVHGQLFLNLAAGAPGPRPPDDGMVIPEPSTFLLLGTGLALVGVWLRRRRSGSEQEKRA